MKKIWCVILFALFIIISGAAFPIYNFEKHYTYALTGIALYLNVVCYMELGIFEKKIMGNWKILNVAIVNLGIILLGMLFRYFLEFGEVSNNYNFTLPNILLHIFVTYATSIISYLLAKKQA